MTEQTEKLLRYAQALAHPAVSKKQDTDIVNIVPSFLQINDIQKINRMTQKPMEYIKF
jgi:bisphosphoglycerate-independent phosphoglycerate mutase (AlkP superfamily)